jgi:hypothetical protein
MPVILAVVAAMKTYTFLCVRADGSRPALEVATIEGDDAARAFAERILGAHSTCDFVEVWDDEDLLFVVSGVQMASLDLDRPSGAPDI